MNKLFNFMAGYKTVAFNVLALLVALAQYYFGALPEVDSAEFATLVTIINLFLRFVTKTPVFVKGV